MNKLKCRKAHDQAGKIKNEILCHLDQVAKIVLLSFVDDTQAGFRINRRPPLQSRTKCN
uniref:Uncharacterized protein n=1 Tax=Arion vulgaris TaxID=1028688 RepID=A0A0B7ABS8_9EUPU